MPTKNIFFCLALLSFYSWTIEIYREPAKEYRFEERAPEEPKRVSEKIPSPERFQEEVPSLPFEKKPIIEEKLPRPFETSLPVAERPPVLREQPSIEPLTYSSMSNRLSNLFSSLSVKINSLFDRLSAPTKMRWNTLKNNISSALQDIARKKANGEASLKLLQADAQRTKEKVDRLNSFDTQAFARNIQQSVEEHVQKNIRESPLSKRLFSDGYRGDKFKSTVKELLQEYSDRNYKNRYGLISPQHQEQMITSLASTISDLEVLKEESAKLNQLLTSGISRDYATFDAKQAELDAKRQQLVSELKRWGDDLKTATKTQAEQDSINLKQRNTDYQATIAHYHDLVQQAEQLSSQLDSLFR